MANFTPNYKLHQWEPSDNFLRTDFNEDFANIEAGLLDACGRSEDVRKQLEDTGGWLADALARTGYEALQTRMAREVDGKAAPLGRGLLFDSLQSAGRVALTGGLGLKSGGGVLLDTGPGLTDFSDCYGTAGYSLITSESSTTKVKYFYAPGNGILKTITLQLRATAGSGAIVMVYQGTRRLWQEQREVGTETAAYTFTPNLALQKDLQYSIQVSRSGNSLFLYYGEGGSGFGYQAACTSMTGTTGTLTTAAQTMDPFRAARVWVRHTAGTVSCALQRGSGAYTTLARQGSRETVDCRGTACTETEFRLPTGQGLGGSTRLRFTLQNSTDATLCDYGAVLI